jgi:hypothetical protein
VAQLPKRPSLDRLRREARLLQRACLAAEPVAAARLAAVFPATDAAQVPLSRAQTVLAREYGLASWPKLVAEVEARRAAVAAPPPERDADMLAEQWFALAALEDLRPLNRALQVGKARLLAARAVMQGHAARYAAFQQALVRGLGSQRGRDRFECAHALDIFGDGSTRAPLVPLMDDPVPRVRWMAMHALSCHACGETLGALEPPIRARILEAALSDPSVRVRQHAAGALGHAGETSAIPALRQMLARETSPKVLRGVAWALGELTRPDKPSAAGL